jgi:hypothetical protein
MQPESKLHRGLVIYYGAVQSAHLISLAWEASNYARTGRFALLAPPPTAGWPIGPERILLLLGTIDALLILASIPFVWGTLRGRSWAARLGAFILTAFSLTALAFAAVTLPSGVWLQSPSYIVEAILFIPIGLLVLIHLRRLTKPLQNGAPDPDKLAQTEPEDHTSSSE